MDKLDPKISTETKLLQTPFVDVGRVQVDFGSFTKHYDVVRFGPRAGVIALRDGKVLLMRQWRLLPGAFGWEIPGGRVDENELTSETARRECMEETGILCDDLEPLISYFPGLDNVDNETTVFISRSCRTAHEFQPDPAEAIEIGWFRPEEILAKIFAGDIKDAFTQIAILAFACHLQQRSA